MLEELLEKLQSGVVKFSYAKKEGDERIAFGTVNPDLVPIQYTKPQIQELYEASENCLSVLKGRLGIVEEDEMQDYEAAVQLSEEALKPFRPKQKREVSSEAKPSEYLNYYDFEAKGWRKFHPEKLVKIY